MRSKHINKTQSAIVPSEHQEHLAVMDWINLNLFNYPELNLIFHIPNGEKRDARTGAKLKRMGVKAGIPDFFLPVPRGSFSGLFLELKSINGKVPKSQIHVIKNLLRNGFAVFVGFGSESAIDALKTYLNNPKEKGVKE